MRLIALAPLAMEIVVPLTVAKFNEAVKLPLFFGAVTSTPKVVLLLAPAKRVIVFDLPVVVT